MLIPRTGVMNENEFRELIHLGLGRAIVYARENDVRAFRDVILDACLHCYSEDAQSEGTRAAYMLELVNLLPDRQFYCDQVLEALAGSGDDWDAVQRFYFAAYMASDGDQRARQMIYASFAPGPKMGEAIAVAFVQLDGLSGFLFAAAKIGALLRSRPDEVDEGWLWMQAVEICSEKKARAALSQDAPTDPNIEAYKLRAVDRVGSPPPIADFRELRTLSYELLRPKLPGLRSYRIGDWGEHASEEEAELAARGLLAARTPEDQLLHLRMFSKRAFPLDPAPLLELALSPDESLASAAANALSHITHARVRDIAFRLVEEQRACRGAAIAMLAQNWKSGDHDVVLRWFENEPDRGTRHTMQMALRHFWDRHPEPATEPRMLHSLYENGPCSFCREFVVQRLIDLNALSAPLRAECAYDANDEICKLVGAAD